MSWTRIMQTYKEDIENKIFWIRGQKESEEETKNEI